MSSAEDRHTGNRHLHGWRRGNGADLTDAFGAEGPTGSRHSIPITFISGTSFARGSPSLDMRSDVSLPFSSGSFSLSA